MNRCIEAVAADRKSMKEMVQSMDLESLLSTADLDLDAIVALA